MGEILRSRLVSNTVFFPRPSSVPPTHWIDVGEVSLACYCMSPYPDAGTILHFHGNGELASDYWMHLANIFVGSGLNVCFVDYRGYGMSGGEANLIDQLQDNHRLVEKLGIPLERLIVYGRSLGSLFAVDLTDRLPSIGGLVLESAMANILEDWPLTRETRQLGKTEAQLHAEVDELFDNQRKLAGYHGELLVLHAQYDTDLDPSHARRLYTWSRAGGKRLIIFPAGCHSSILEENGAQITEALAAMGERLRIRTSRRLHGD